MGLKHAQQYHFCLGDEPLVVASAHAKYQGTGTIKGSSNYGFILTATDRQVNGGGGVDKFRIKIWDKNNGDLVVYDNQISEDDDSNAGTALGGDSIAIHKWGRLYFSAKTRRDPSRPGGVPSSTCIRALGVKPPCDRITIMPKLGGSDRSST